MMTSKFQRPSSLLLIALALLIGMLPVSLRSQNHPELKWYTFESEHFIFHYHEGTERSARMALTVSEEIYPYVTGLYQWAPKEKTQIIIQDTDDYANGGAYYFDNKIVLWASPADFLLRGNHNWMRNVFTHEFSHIVSLGKSMRFPINVPAGFIQVLDREKPLRDNIILEYPRGIGVFPISNVLIPMWFAEGAAQFQADGEHNDYWDSVRDMILRYQALNSKLYDIDEIAHFGKRITGNESVYNSGFSFVRYLSQRYGEKFLSRLTETASGIKIQSFERAFLKCAGESLDDVYDDYRRDMEKRYSRDTEIIRRNLRSGRITDEPGPGNFNVSFSPDGTMYALSSSRNQDYLGQTALYLHRDGKTKKISGRTRGQIAWTADGKELYFAKQANPDIYGSIWYDLARYDIAKDKETRLTFGKRVYSVAVTPSGRIFVILVHDGTHNLAEYFPDSDSLKMLTDYRDGEQIYSMAVTPDDSLIYFDMALTFGRDIYSLNLQDNRVRAEVSDPRCDIRTPSLSPDGRTLYYSSDRSGIFNLYRHGEDRDDLLSNVTGAAFDPDVKPGSDSLYYTLYDDGQFKLAALSAADTPVNADSARYESYRQPQAAFQPDALKSYTSKPYEQTFSRLFFMPYALLDYNKIKLGTVIYQSEILDKFNMTASAAVNSILDMDIYGRIDYNKLLPSIFLEGYYVSYHLDSKSGTLYDFYPEKNTYSFSLWEAVAGMQYRWFMHNFQFAVSHDQYSSTVNVKQTFPRPQLFTYSYSYFKGTRYEFDYSGNFTGIDWRSNISPRRGFRYDLKVAWDDNRFIDGFGINADFGTLETLYKDNSTLRGDLNAEAYIPIPGTETSALGFQFSGGYLENTHIDSFFHYFGGGMPGLKGYPYYSIEGTRLGVLTSLIRFPLVKKMKLNLHPVYFDKIYLSLYHQAGDAWRGGPGDAKFKQDAGAELRFGGYSYYAYPLALSLDAVYALSEFKSYDKTLGKTWRYYVKLLFEF